MAHHQPIQVLVPTATLRKRPWNHIPPSSEVGPQKRSCQDSIKAPSRKHQRHTSPPSKRVRLTKRNLKAFDQMGKADPHSGKSVTGTTKSVSTTSRGFEEQAVRNGILLDEDVSIPPANLAELQEILNRRRASTSPTESNYKAYLHAVKSQAANEEAVKMAVYGRLMLPYYNDPAYSTSWNQQFSSFPRNVGFNDNLSPAQPDLFQGFEGPQFPLRLHDELGGAIRPHPHRFTPTLSHLAGEWKGPGKNMGSARHQSAYDGACLVYGRNKALGLLECSDLSSHASVQTFTTDGTTLNTYAHYALENHRGDIQYHQYPTSATLLCRSLEDYRDGFRIQRNMQEHAKDTCRTLRDQFTEYEERLSSTVSSQLTADGAAEVASTFPTDNSKISTSFLEAPDDVDEDDEVDELSLEQPIAPASLSTRNRRRRESVHFTDGMKKLRRNK